MPPSPARIDASAWDALAQRTVSGAYHIHTTRSDGHGDRTAVAAAAARAGLRFVVLTDHGDGTRPPDPPVYIDNVLVLDGVEISSEHGHYVAIDMPRAPYPLGGSGETVVEDVRRLGGFGIVAHPDSPKPALQWKAQARPDGLEWLNLDSEWRDEGRGTLLRAGFGYLLRKGPALATILDRPVSLDDRWTSLLARGRAVALAAADAHGGVGRRQEDPGRSPAGAVGIPGYEASFRVFSNRVVLDAPLSGDAAADARTIYTAIRRGRVFSAIDAQAGPALLDFSAHASGQTLRMGDAIPGGTNATLLARVAAPPGSRISLVGQHGIVVSVDAPELRHAVTAGKGPFRVEVHLPGRDTRAVPWLVSNPIYFGEPGPAGDSTGVVRGPALPSAIAPFPWRIEKDPSSSAMVRTGATDASLEFKLGDGTRHDQFVALATDITPPIRGIQLALASDRPMRVSIQLRTPDGGRWGRSVYVEPAGASIAIPVSTLSPIGRPAGSIAGATSLMLVIDLTNAQPGRSGTLRVLSSALQ